MFSIDSLICSGCVASASCPQDASKVWHPNCIITPRTSTRAQLLCPRCQALHGHNKSTVVDHGTQNSLRTPLVFGRADYIELLNKHQDNNCARLTTSSSTSTGLEDLSCVPPGGVISVVMVTWGIFIIPPSIPEPFSGILLFGS